MSFVSKFSFMLKCSINPVLRKKLDSRNEVSVVLSIVIYYVVTDAIK